MKRTVEKFVFLLFLTGLTLEHKHKLDFTNIQEEADNNAAGVAENSETEINDFFK